MKTAVMASWTTFFAILDQCQCRSNCAPTPPLTQPHSTEENWVGGGVRAQLRSCPDTEIYPFFPQTILNIKFSYFVEEKKWFIMEGEREDARWEEDKISQFFLPWEGAWSN